MYPYVIKKPPLWHVWAYHCVAGTDHLYPIQPHVPFRFDHLGFRKIGSVAADDLFWYRGVRVGLSSYFMVAIRNVEESLPDHVRSTNAEILTR
jgi:hypothetical protein